MNRELPGPACFYLPLINSFVITEKSVNYFDKQNYRHENHDYPYQIKCGHDVSRIPSAPAGCRLPCHQYSKSNPTTPDRMTHVAAGMTSYGVSLFYFSAVRVFLFSFYSDPTVLYSKSLLAYSS